MDLLHMVKPRPPLSMDELIVRAARSWDPDFPGRDELPHKYADLCRMAVKLAKATEQKPGAALHELCRSRGIDESEVMQVLEALALRIEEEGSAPGEMQKMQAALTSKTRGLWQRLR